MGVESQEDETDLAMREVFNYVRAAEMAFGVLPDRGLTQGLVKELQAMLVDRTASETSDSGGVRNRQVVIGPPGSAVQDARFVPPPPGPQLVAALDEWEAWVRRPHPKLTVVTQAAMAHYQFETIHPFSDGNGRIGRLVIVLHLIQAGVLTDGLLSVSPWFEQRRRDYQDHLLSVSMTGDWDPWVAFFAMALRDQARATIDQVRSLLELQGRFRDLAKERVWTGLAATVLEELIGFPVFSVKSLAKRHGVAFPTANRVVGQLKEARVLTEITGRTYRRTFMAPEVYRIIAR